VRIFFGITGASGAPSAASLLARLAGAASAALKGRKLVLVPGETPLSSIHLESMLRPRTPGAVVLFAAPGLDHAPETSDDPRAQRWRR
jgi:4-hydroxy-3-polyprenylbenzoate decarboxylase